MHDFDLICINGNMAHIYKLKYVSQIAIVLLLRVILQSILWVDEFSQCNAMSPLIFFSLRRRRRRPTTRKSPSHYEVNFLLVVYKENCSFGKQKSTPLVFTRNFSIVIAYHSDLVDFGERDCNHNKVHNSRVRIKVLSLRVGSKRKVRL